MVLQAKCLRGSDQICGPSPAHEPIAWSVLCLGGFKHFGLFTFTSRLCKKRQMCGATNSGFPSSMVANSLSRAATKVPISGRFAPPEQSWFTPSVGVYDGKCTSSNRFAFDDVLFCRAHTCLSMIDVYLKVNNILHIYSTL